ncbi:MAG: Dam family site-specific DNA-(adenine-N6)-methyltransferase [Acidobacteria bacterium]|nr:MAG: Dam family site-specific DNA-(adenine-N6)-methyltransferase [Acidobacteriota bacterium]
MTAKASMATEVNLSAEPFLRWIGGKRRLAKKLLDFIPSGARERRYFEPFMGAGSLFFALRPKKAILADLNSHLIDCYSFVRDRHNGVHSELTRLARTNTERQYYAVRGAYNRSGPSATQAARFIFLNHTCFNGVFRVNRQGAFNVPYGFKQTPNFPSKAHLAAVSAALLKCSLTAADYETVLRGARKDDFIYLDPPYPPLNGTSNFTRYTRFRFAAPEQERLAANVRALDRKGCLLMITNADTPRIRQLYEGFSLFELKVTRFVTYKSVKHRVGELVITNYQPTAFTLGRRLRKLGGRNA